MKNILSIAAVSAIATLTLSMSVKADNNCICSFEKYSNIIRNEVQCCRTNFEEGNFKSTGDAVIDELLKGCETIYKDNCKYCDNEKPDHDDLLTQIPDEEQSIPEKPNRPGNSTTPDNDEDNSINNNVNNSIDSEYSSYINEIIRLVNQERTSRGLNKLTSSNVSLSKAADVRAREQASLFSHTRPSGQKWSTVLSDYSVSYKTAGENVAYGQRTPSEVMQSWMNSSGHRANILGENFSQIGVGIYYKNGTYYWSQLFIG